MLLLRGGAASRAGFSAQACEIIPRKTELLPFDFQRTGVKDKTRPGHRVLEETASLSGLSAL